MLHDLLKDLNGHIISAHIGVLKGTAFFRGGGGGGWGHGVNDMVSLYW